MNDHGFITLTLVETGGPKRFNIDHIVGYDPGPVSGSLVETTTRNTEWGMVLVVETPTEIDSRITTSRT